MDREHVGAEEVGKILIPTDQIMSGEPLEGWFPLIVSSGGAEQGAVHIAFQLFPPLALSVGKVLEGGYFQVWSSFWLFELLQRSGEGGLPGYNVPGCGYSRLALFSRGDPAWRVWLSSNKVRAGNNT